MTTTLPVKYRFRAMRTCPAFGARTGVPDGLKKSPPLCGLRGWPLKMLREPNALLAWPGTGRTNGSSHNRVGADCVQTRSRSFASRAIRSNSSGGGFTNPGWTFRWRVGKLRRETTTAVVARSVEVADREVTEKV